MNQRYQISKTQINTLISSLQQMQFNQQTFVSTHTFVTKLTASVQETQTKKRMFDFDVYDDIDKALYSQFETKLQVKLSVDEDLFRIDVEKICYCFKHLKNKATQRIYF